MARASVGHEDRSRTWRRVKEYRWQYLMFLPAMVLLILFSYMPMAGLVGAFKDYRIGYTLTNSPWCGWDNFQFFQDSHFWKVVRNTLAITVGRMVFGFPAPIILALLLNELNNQKFKRIAQSVSYMPHFISWIVVAYLLESLLSPMGLFNQLNRALGRTPVFYMGREDTFVPIIIISGIWKDIGWNTIVYLAALSGIDPQLIRGCQGRGSKQMAADMEHNAALHNAHYSIATYIVHAGFDSSWHRSDISAHEQRKYGCGRSCGYICAAQRLATGVLWYVHSAGSGQFIVVVDVGAWH